MIKLKKRAVIVASKTNSPLEIIDCETYLIGVEQGALDLIKKGYQLDLAISDWDKVNQEQLLVIQKTAKHFQNYNTNKDYLDGELAIRYAQKQGYKDIYFVAEPGKRYDKNISICELVWKYNINFINLDTEIFLLNIGENKLDYQKYQKFNYISFYAKQPTIITINNLKYNVQNLILNAWENKCISNAFIKGLNPSIKCNQPIICILSR